MKSKIYPQKEKLYRLPWSMNDNPIGWVEVTDICNIKCEGCYRLIMGEGHKPLKQIKEEIIFLKKWRNCDNISIAGGEPILHPQITEILQFIKSLKMKSIVLTNGYALTEELLVKLKKAGLTGLSFHLDSTQIRPEFKKEKIESEADLNELRLKYAKMLRRHGLYAHFGITVSTDNFHEVPRYIQWAIDHNRLISGISLIIYRGLPISAGIDYFAKGKKIDMASGNLGYTVDTDGTQKIGISSKDVYAIIKEHFPGYEASCYLGGTEDHTSLKWLIGNMIVHSNGKVLGAYGKKFLEFAQVFHHLFRGTYIVYPKSKIGRKIFLASFFDKHARRAFGKYLAFCLSNPLRFFRPVSPMGIGIIQAPDLLPDGRVDMCDDCPDMCVHEGKLVNSCRLDECRIYGDLLHVHVDEQGRELIRKYRGKEEGKKKPQPV